MDRARSVTATSTLNKYTLAFSKVGEGTVTSSPTGIACGSTCEALFDYGTTVTLTPDPGLGYSFKDWTGTHAADLTYNNDGTWSILINGNKSVTANFVTGIVITAYPDFYEMAQGSGSLFVSEGEGVLINDDRPTEVSLYALRIAGSGPAQGELSLDPNGSFTLFNVPSTFVGNLYFNYKACDLATDICSEPATVTIAVKTVPTADPDTYKMGLATTMTVVAPGVLVNDNDGLIAVLEAKVVANPTGGNLTLNANGSFTYTQTAAWMGSDSFTYKACDGTICSAPTTVTIEESDSCLVVDPASLEKTLLPDDTGTLNLTLSNECAVPVDFTLVESGDVVNTPILEEGFENETNPTLPPDFPPDGWELLDTRADRTWKLTQYTIEYPQYVDEGQFAAWVEYSEPGILSDEWLISPVLDISTLTNPVLSFRVSSQTFHKGGTLKIWVTDVNGDPITTFSEEPLWDLLRDVNWPDYAFRTVQVDLGQFNSYDEIRIAWQYVSVDSSVRGASFGMDAVKVGGRSAIPWLSQTPTSGTIDGGKERVITVTFNSSGLNFGRYEGMLFVRNAPYPVINVPVTLIVRAETDFLIYLPLITK